MPRQGGATLIQFHMCLEKLPPFGKMLIGAIGGALLGIAFGLLLSLLIAWVSIQFSVNHLKANIA